jgi:hypothetical protein
MAYAAEFGRRTILKRGMKFDEGWLDLTYSGHAFKRLKERLKGDIVVYPKRVNISKLNIYKGYTYDGEYLYKIIIRLDYKTDEWIYLVIIPSKKLVKTLWFKKKNERRDNKTMGFLPTDLEGIAGGEEMPELL